MDTSNSVENLINGFVDDLSAMVRRVALDAMKSAMAGSSSVASGSSPRSGLSTGRTVPPTTVVASERPAAPSSRRAEAAAPAQPVTVPKKPSTPPPQVAAPVVVTPAVVAKATPTRRRANGAAPAAKRGAMRKGAAAEKAKPSAPPEVPAKGRARHPRLIGVPAQNATVAKLREAVAEAQPGNTSYGHSPAPIASPAATAPQAATAAAPGRPALPESAEREGMVLAGVRALVRPTAVELADHCRLPVHSVHASLRALVTNGQVAKTETGRGQEYALVSPGAVRPFKRSRNGAPNTESNGATGGTDTAATSPVADAPVAAAR